MAWKTLILLIHLSGHDHTEAALDVRVTAPLLEKTIQNIE